MNSRGVALLFVTGFAIASCSEKSPPPTPSSESESREKESQPDKDQIAEDCVAFVQATKVSPAKSTDCPGCSGEQLSAIAFRQMHLDRISCTAVSCEATVTLRAVFNTAASGIISGGLTAWISPDQRQDFLNGHPPAGEQVYRVKITYKRTGDAWRAIEFDRAD
ncbi:MAG: hypothetical protein ABR611_05640 [Chthoniobacterales bacterium]